MAAHRYWRAVGVEATGKAGLALSELHLLVAGSRVDALAVFTSSAVPATGSLAALQDDNGATGAAWGAGDLLAGLQFYWDFGGSPQDVTDMAVGAGVSAGQFLNAIQLQWSDDGSAWTTLAAFFGMPWPGVGAKLSSISSVDPLAGSTAIHLPMMGNLNDAFRPPVTVTGGVSLTTANAKFGAVSGAFDGSGRVVVDTGLDTITTAAAGYTVELWVRIATFGVNPYYLVSRGDSGYLSGFVLSIDGDRKAYAQYGTASGEVIAKSPTVMPLNTWVHLAAVRNGFALTLYVDGVAVASGSGASISDNTRPIAIGYDPRNSLRGFIGQMFDVRVTKAARYTANFVPPLLALPRYLFASIRPVPEAPRVLSAASVPMVYGQTRVRELLRGRFDFLTGVLGKGIGRVRGQTLDYVPPTNQPYRCRVRLIREVDGLVVRELWSGADGGYDFQYVDELQSYSVLAYYLDHGKRAVVSDGMTLANGKVEVMA